MSWMTAASAGIILVCWLPALPPAWLYPVLPPVLLPLAVFTSGGLRFVVCLILGVLWGCQAGHRLVEQQLPGSLAGLDLVVTGEIAEPPSRRQSDWGTGWRFHFRAESLPWREQGGDILLTWYTAQDLRAGQRWQLQLRLRRPRGFVNPGGFDYQAWLLSQRIIATGYVVATQENRRLPDSVQIGAGWLRQRLSENLERRFADHPRLPQLLALGIGSRARIAPGDWKLYALTGTIHLMVISGLHVGLIAGLIFWLVRRLARGCPRMLKQWPDRKWAVAAAVLGVSFYAALAGYSLPTQRALIMVAVLGWATVSDRVCGPFAALASALFLVLLLDPLAPISSGFWLSFLAVSALLLGFSGRIHRGGGLRGLARAQIVAFLGLFPVLQNLGLPVSLSSPVANVVAVPLVGFFVVPLCMVGTLIDPVLPLLGGFCLELALFGLDCLHFWLEWLLGIWPDALVELPAMQMLERFLMALGFLVMLLPGSLGSGLIGGLLIVGALLHPRSEAPWLLDLFVLDVGQGQSVIVRTPEHTLVFDPGPYYSEGFEAGAAIVAPALRWLGVERVDRLIVSHGDRDHAGGLRGLLDAIPVTGVFSSEPARLTSVLPTRPCRMGQKWRWNDIDFRMLHPADQGYGSENNRSCVLLLSVGDFRILLSGDIEAAAERSLLRKFSRELKANVLIAPHHGSRTSSTHEFVAAVNAELVLFSAGWRNRYGHPHPEVTERYLAAGAKLLRTDRNGALRIRVQSADLPLLVETWRERKRRYWFD